MRRSIYSCEICKKEFDRKGNYEVHLNRKIPCGANKTKIEYVDIIKMNKKETNDKFDAQNKKIEELEKKIEQLILKNSPSTEN